MFQCYLSLSVGSVYVYVCVHVFCLFTPFLSVLFVFDTCELFIYSFNAIKVASVST